MKSIGILFDYNGVIVDDEHLQEKATAIAVKQFGVELTHELFKEHCLGQTDKLGLENLKTIFPQMQNASIEALAKVKTEVYFALIEHESILYPGIKDQLQKFSEQFHIALVSGARRVEIISTLEEESIEHYFQAIITAEDVTRSKPDPEGYRKGVAALNLPPKNIVAVEDTPTGVAAAKGAGVKCIAVLHNLPADKLQAADKIVEKVTDITPDIIRELVVA